MGQSKLTLNFLISFCIQLSVAIGINNDHSNDIATLQHTFCLKLEAVIYARG